MCLDYSCMQYLREPLDQLGVGMYYYAKSGRSAFSTGNDISDMFADECGDSDKPS